LGWDTHLTQNDTGRGQSTRQIATRSVQSFLHRDQVISWVGMSVSCLATMSTVHGCDRQTDMTMKNTLLNWRCEALKWTVESESMESIDFQPSRSTESTKVELIDRFSVESSRFVRLDWFQGLVKTLITWGLTSPVTVTTVAFTAIIMVKVVYASSHRVEEWKSEGGIANISSSQAFAASITHQTRHCLLSADWLSDC